MRYDLAKMISDLPDMINYLFICAKNFVDSDDKGIVIVLAPILEMAKPLYEGDEEYAALMGKIEKIREEMLCLAEAMESDTTKQ